MQRIFGTLLLAALLTAPAAHANDLAVMKEDGIQYALTDERSFCAEGENAIRQSADGLERRAGCYTLDPTTVHVRWSDNTVESFNIKRFRATPFALRQAEKERRAKKGGDRYETPVIERSIPVIPDLPPVTN
ncbi:hypothetical protein LF41_2995 [Lysobacter dokdonensis DS-58]|uniref:Secreted protein n=1 Tax=Lysobacter dokdonensis DS-58 TaxID=1300345 RepID=A0A0A2WM34_9GAMM|nr:hypothetical protein [Lysobacter dokdonensis]KGQ19345.1 hypothetical protein LF41_2995 [Lysobacter dokdonensis DS-58]